MMKRCNTLCLFLSVFFNFAFTEAPITDKTDSLLKKAEQDLYIYPQQSVYYALQAKDKAPSPVKEAQALYVYATAERLQGNFDNSIQALYEAEEILPKGNNILRGNIYNMMSLVYANLEDYNRAIALSNNAISLFKTENDSVYLAQCYNTRGIIHTYINEFEQADHFLKKALVINRSTKNLKYIAANLNNLCLYQGNTDEQLKWINEAIVI